MAGYVFLPPSDGASLASFFGLRVDILGAGAIRAFFATASIGSVPLNALYTFLTMARKHNPATTEEMP